LAQFEPKDEGFEARVRESFARQQLFVTIGAELTRVAPGEVEIRLPFDERLTQQHGFLHAGVIASIVDTACGYSAMSLLPPGSEVLTIEFKMNLLAPATGGTLVATGRVVRPGRTVTVCLGDVAEVRPEGSKPIATMLASIITRPAA
jgi:uncharacterized protein (TIGR00369 family)